MPILHLLELSHHYKEFLALAIESLRDFKIFQTILLLRIIIPPFCAYFVYWAWLIGYGKLSQDAALFFCGYQRILKVKTKSGESARTPTLMCFCNKSGWLVKIVSMILNFDIRATAISQRIGI